MVPQSQMTTTGDPQQLAEVHRAAGGRFLAVSLSC